MTVMTRYYEEQQDYEEQQEPLSRTHSGEYMYLKY